MILMKDLFLIIASILTVGCVIPYIRDILKGTTKPNIVSWLTWTILTSIATVAEFADGEYRTAIFTSAAVIETTLIVILGLKYGYAKWSKFDTVCQIGAFSGFFFWWLFNSPAMAVISVVVIDSIGALPTIRHSWLKPGEETWSAYAIATVGGIFAIASFSQYNWTSLTYAVYIVCINALLVLILRRNTTASH